MPTKWPCENAIDCPCADGNPLGNFSSEAPDPFTFFARRFFPNPVQIGEPDRDFTSIACGQACNSTVSQEDADACALRLANQCVLPPDPPQPGDPVLFGNRALSCQASCPEGPPFTLSIPAGTYLARTQELADLIAQSFCQADVIRFRHCEMPPMPPPPSAICPHITTQTASPINANDGDNVNMTVNYTYNSSMMLMFVWFKDGIATYTTPSSSLTLNAVGPGDQGQYILGIYATGCFPVFSSPITLNVTSSCPPEAGIDPPATLDIASPTEWELVTVSQADVAILVSSDAFTNPTNLSYFTPSYGLDHAPGIYGELYMSGFLDESSLGLCGGPTPVAGTLNMLYLVNEQYNIDSPIPGGFASLNNGVFKTWTGTPPPGAAQFQFFSTPCEPDAVTVQVDIDAVASGTVVTSFVYPPDEINQFKHTNVGGMFTYYFDTEDATPNPTPILVPIVFKVLQLEGQIPQPRKLQLDNFGVIAAQFTDPAIAANWGGNIDTRTTYTSAALLWSQPASGGFGGATIEWINNHPTSANGFGWKLKVFGAGPTLVWQGLKGIDADALGLYYKDSTATPIGPDCINVSDASTTQWFP